MSSQDVSRLLMSILALACVSSFPASPATAAAWKNLRTGLDYRELAENTHTLHAFRIDLAHFTLSPLVENPPFPIKYAAQHAGAMLAINANFFDPAKNPLGLIVKEFKTLNPPRPVKWWGVFFIETTQTQTTAKTIAKIAAQSDYVSSAHIETAIQSGPRLLADGNAIPNLKDTLSEKSALCLPDPEHVIVIASQGVLSVAVFTRILKDELRCQSALNLDGGSSTQLYAKVKGFELHLPAATAVPVLLGAFPKQAPKQVDDK